LARLRYCNAIYGLMRADAMRKTRLVGDYIGSDIVFQAELALYGWFWEIPEFLFFRRLHPAASSSMSDRERRAFYDPAHRRGVALAPPVRAGPGGGAGAAAAARKGGGPGTPGPRGGRGARPARLGDRRCRPRSCRGAAPRSERGHQRPAGSS